MRSRLLLAVAGAAAVSTAMATAGCQASGADKAGTQTTVLRLASIDQVNDNGQSFGPQAFIDSLSAVSGGKLKVQVITEYGNGDVNAETNLVKAIASGDLDGGWPATRAFAGAGMTGLSVVEAPMTITSYAAEKALVSGPVAGKLLATLDGSGVVGLGLAVGPLRRPFAAEAPLVAADDWKGARFRAFNSPVQSQTIKALGATPVGASFDWIDQVRAGKLRGAEFDLAQYAKNGLSTEAGNVTSNVVLWPKVFVLSLSSKRFDTLTPEQQAWVKEAARRAVQASATATYDENALAKKLCGQGVHFRAASAEQIAGLRAAVRPVLDTLAADSTSGPLLRQIEAIAAQHPQADVPDDAGSCQGDAAGGSVGAIPTTPSSLPEGIYRVSISADDVGGAGFSNANGLSGTWTLTVRRGTYEVSCRPLDLPGKDCGNDVHDGPLEVGDLRGTGRTVYFVTMPERLAKITGCALPASSEDGHCPPASSYSAAWTVSGDSLRFSDVRMSCDCDNLSVKPWRKIG